MHGDADHVFPRARRDEIVVRELPDELLIYDLARQKAHCLNNCAALVWKHSNGKRSLTDLTRVLRNEGLAVDDDVVWFALQQLERYDLIDKEIQPPPVHHRVSRRDLVRKYLPAALVLPVIISIAAPTVAQVGTCFPNGAICNTSSECCSGCCNDGNCGPLMFC